MVLYDLIDSIIFLKMLIKGGELVMYYINREYLNIRDFDELSNYWGESDPIMTDETPLYYPLVKQYVVSRVLCEVLGKQDHCEIYREIEPVLRCIEENNGIVSECTQHFKVIP